MPIKGYLETKKVYEIIISAYKSQTARIWSYKLQHMCINGIYSYGTFKHKYETSSFVLNCYSNCDKL